jgi:hypothetical protein
MPVTSHPSKKSGTTETVMLYSSVDSCTRHIFQRHLLSSC